MSEWLLRAGWLLIGVGSMWACWELRAINNRTRQIDARTERFGRGLVCDAGVCAREERRSATGNPADLTIPFRPVG